MAPVEHIIYTKLLPNLTGQPIDSALRHLFSLPCREGRLGVLRPTTLGTQYCSSRSVTSSLVENIVAQCPQLGDALTTVSHMKTRVRNEARRRIQKAAASFITAAPESLQRTINLARQSGEPSWLTCRPLKAHGLSLSKSEFREGLALRYGWQPSRLPSSCVCGEPFDVTHALSCSTGGYPKIRHNELRDVTANLLKRVAMNVAVEPRLQPLTGERLQYRTAITDDQARLDVAASGVWSGRFEHVFLDVRVFNPFAQSNRTSSLTSTYQRHEKEKCRHYGQRVRDIEHATFLPLVFSASGGMGKSATTFCKRVASLVSEKTKEPYSQVMSWIRCRLSFALLKSSIACLRGARRIRPLTKDHLPLKTAFSGPKGWSLVTGFTVHACAWKKQVHEHVVFRPPRGWGEGGGRNSQLA